MVLGFGRGPERFPSSKEQTPGPGTYDPKDLETKLPPKSGFLTGERFSSQDLEGNPEVRPEPSPPRERRPAISGNDRSYSWATQRIHELGKELDAANKRVKEQEKLAKEQGENTEKAKQDLAAAAEYKDELQKRLSELEQELALVRGELAEVKEHLIQVSAKEAKASKSAKAGAARVEQLILQMHQAVEVRKQLEQQHCASQKYADELKREAEEANAALAAAERGLEAARIEQVSLLSRFEALEHKSREWAAELSQLEAKRAEAESQLVSVENSNAATRARLQESLSALSESKVAADRSNNEVQRLQEDLAAAQEKSSSCFKKLAAVQADLAAATHENETLSSHVRTKEATLEALNHQLESQTSDVIQLRLDVSNLSAELQKAQEAVQQRDAVVSRYESMNAGLSLQVTEKDAEIRRLNEELGQHQIKLDEVSAREEALKVVKAQLEEHLGAKAVLCERQAEELRECKETFAQQQQLIVSKEADASRLNELLLAERAMLQARADEVSQLTICLSERETTNASLQLCMAELRDAVTAQEGGLGTMTCEVHQLSVVRSELEADIAEMKAVLADRDAALTSLADDLADANAALQERDAQIVQLKAEAEAAEDHANATSELVSALEDSLSKIKNTARNAERRISELEASYAELQSELRMQSDNCLNLSAELSAVKSALTDTAAAESALHQKLESTNTLLESAELAKQDLQQQFNKVTVEMDAAREAFACLSRSHESLGQSEAVLRLELQEQRDHFALEVPGLRGQLAEAQAKLTAKLAGLDAAQKSVHMLNSQLQDAYAVSKQQASELSQARVELASRSAAVEQLQQTVKDMEHALAGLATANTELTQTLSLTEQNLSSRLEQCNGLGNRVTELEALCADMAMQRTHAQAAVEQLQAEKVEITARARVDVDKANARVAALDNELVESRDAAASLGAELAQLVTDLEKRDQEIKELKVARHETSSALTAVTAERADLHSQLGEVRRREVDLRAELTAARARCVQLEAETQSLHSLVTSAQDEARASREETYTVQEVLDKAQDQIRMLQLQEPQIESLRQELEAMCLRLRDADARNEGLQNQVAHMENQVASMTPICSRAKLDDQVRALSEVLENSQVRICDLEEQLRHNDLLGTTGALELRRLTDENEHLWLRVKKMEEDIKEQAALGHNNHKQKIQYHLRLKQELEELRHECTVLLRDKFQLEQCIRYLAVQVGTRFNDRRLSLPTGERKAIEKVLPPCLAYNAIYSTPLSQRAAKLSARGKHNEHGTVYAGGKETFEEGISEAQRKFFNVAANLRNEFQFAATAVGTSPIDDLTEGGVDNTDTGAADGALRPDISSSPDGKAARPSTPSNKAPAAFGTPVATIRGAVTPASCSTQGALNGAPHNLAKLEDRLKQVISDVCAPATSRHAVEPLNVATAAMEIVGRTSSVVSTQQRGATIRCSRDQDQDQERNRDSVVAGAGPSSSNGGAWGSNGGAAGLRERAPRQPAVPGGDVTVCSRGPGISNRRLTSAGGTRTAFKS